jgi:hypothetical protein
MHIYHVLALQQSGGKLQLAAEAMCPQENTHVPVNVSAAAPATNHLLANNKATLEIMCLRNEE